MSRNIWHGLHDNAEALAAHSSPQDSPKVSNGQCTVPDTTLFNLRASLAMFATVVDSSETELIDKAPALLTYTSSLFRITLSNSLPVGSSKRIGLNAEGSHRDYPGLDESCS